MKIQDIDAMNSKTYITDSGKDNGGSAGILAAIFSVTTLAAVIYGVGQSTKKDLAYGFGNSNYNNLLHCMMNNNNGVTAINGLPSNVNAQII